MSTLLKVYVCCCILMFGSAFSVTMLLSYLPFLVKFLLPDVEDRDVGRYSGIIDTSMFLGRILGGFVWGRLADAWSRKNVFMWSAVGIALSCLLFGFSTNFYMAVILRFFVGLLNGVVGNSKAAVSQYTKQSRQAFGMAVMICSWATGYVAGQALSGAVADPIDQYNLPSNAFLEKYPYCLPAIVCALINTAAAISTLCLFPSDVTHDVFTKEHTAVSHAQRSSTDNKMPDNSSIELSPVVEHHVSSCDPETIDGDTGVAIYRLSYSQLLEQENSAYGYVLESGVSNSEPGVPEPDRETSKSVSSKTLSIQRRMLKRTRNAFTSSLTVMLSILKDRVSFAVLMNYAVLSIAVIGFDETYPLWAADSPELGGLGFSVHKIALSQGIIGVSLLPFTLCYFPALQRRIGTTMALIINCLLASICFILLPSLTYVSANPVVLWSLLLTLLLVIRVSIVACLTASSLLVNNASTTDRLGSMNGISLTMLSAGRAIAPIMMGSIYSFSLSPNNERIGYPVDFHLVFIVNGAILTGCTVIAAFYPRSLDNSKQVIPAVPADNNG